MGKPILYVLGISTLDDLPTLASLTILGKVAKKAAEYQNRIIIPAYDPLVMLVAQETVKSAFMDAGRPDAYNENDIYFVTNSQFSYAAAVSGIMMREKQLLISSWMVCSRELNPFRSRFSYRCDSDCRIRCCFPASLLYHVLRLHIDGGRAIRSISIYVKRSLTDQCSENTGSFKGDLYDHDNHRNLCHKY